MRSIRFAFALLGLAGVLVAADPFVGTWKLNHAKSKYKTGAPAKEQTVTIAESGSDLDVTVSGTSADGMPFSSHYTVPAAGGEGRSSNRPMKPFPASAWGQTSARSRTAKAAKPC